MNDLHTWLSQQHHGLRTFRTFQQKLDTLGRDDPAQRGLCRLLSGLVGSYVEAFDEAPLPVEIADSAYQRLLTLVESIDLHGDASRLSCGHQSRRGQPALAVTRQRCARLAPVSRTYCIGKRPRAHHQGPRGVRLRHATTYIVRRRVLMQRAA